ncbi:hypothetical protein ACSSZE_10895 [Acidithiobacillus caldus]
MTPDEAFTVYLNFAPELEFLHDGNIEDAAFIEVMQTIAQDTTARETFLNDADTLYGLAEQCFFDQAVKPFENQIKALLPGKSVTTKRRIGRIEGDWQWSIKDGSRQLFQVGFFFAAAQGYCVATPWFWHQEHVLNNVAKYLRDDFFNPPSDGSWYKGTLIANPVAYRAEQDLLESNISVARPIIAAVRRIMAQLSQV